MGKKSMWLLTTTVVILAVGLFSCSQNSPFAPSSNSNSSVTSPTGPQSNDAAIIPGEYIVVLKSAGSAGLGKVSPHDAMQVAASAGVEPQRVYTTVLNGFAAKMTSAQYKALLNHPAVDYIEPNRTIHMDAQTVPWGITAVKAPLAQARGVRGANVKVGIIDTGIDYNHPDLAANYAGGYNFVANSTNPMDDNGHGTHVSGTVAAIDNTIGVIGVAPSARLYGVKVLDATGSGTFANVIAGIDWCAANGMQVANMSLGASSGSSALQTSCDNAYAAGVVLCAAAGNGYGAPVSYPAAYASCIAVTAIDQNNNLASFSNVGPQVSVTAPGVGVYSTWPGSSYATLDGTSMATPHATGVCALIWSTGSYTTALAVRNRLTSTATDLGPVGKDNSFGYGLVNADAATAGGTGNLPPIANANGPYTGTVGTAIQFSSAGSSDPDGTIASYSWNFGDGGTSTLANPTHAYATAGTYTVTLTVTDNLGATGSNSTTATITGGTTDVVTITLAQYTRSRSRLEVRATSSRQPTPTLTVVGYGTMTWNTNGYYRLLKTTSPGPTSVTVTSSLGGSATKTVTFK